MMQTVVALTAICLLVLLVSGAPPKDTDKKWEQYKQKYQKVYKTHDEKMRKAVFVKNLQNVQEHNQRHAAGKETYTLGVNQFSDLTYEEFANQYLGLKVNKKLVNANKEVHHDELDKVLDAVDIPTTVNWVTAGAVTPVKNQEQCESCWAFSATGSIEGQYAIKRKQSVNLSEQQLVDCSQSYGNMGCYGGLYTYAYEYIQANGGIDSEASYPYLGVDSTCDYKSSEKAATVTGYVDLPENDEDALTNAIATVGPIAVAILATNNLQSYSGGVLKDSLCANIGTDINHGVLAVGYGVDGSAGPYYLVKNSWGAGWGLQGYFMLARNDSNMCNIAYIPAYPLVPTD